MAIKCPFCSKAHFANERCGVDSEGALAANLRGATNSATNKAPVATNAATNGATNEDDVATNAENGSARTANRRTREAFNAYQRDYMRRRRAKAKNA